MQQLTITIFMIYGTLRLISLSATILIAAGPIAYAQRTYSNGQTNGTTARCVRCGVTDAANVTDTDHTNFATGNGQGDRAGKADKHQLWPIPPFPYRPLLFQLR